MAVYNGGCMGRGTESSLCICVCHGDITQQCDDLHCAPVSAKASDNVRLRHINRNPDRGKRETKRGNRALRRA